jgi:hypothetical protein
MPLGLGSRELTQQTNRVYVPQGLITRLFFGENKYFETKYVDVVVTKGGRKLAPYVSPKIGGKVMRKEGGTVKTYEPPMLKPKFVTEADSILNQQAVFSADGMDASERAAEQLIKDEADIKASVARTKEQQAVELVTTGKFTAKGEGVEEEFDYGMDANNIEILTGVALWTDAGSDPIAALGEWRTDIFKATGKAPNAVVMGADVAAAFMAHDRVIKAFDTRNITIGELRPKIMLDEDGNELDGVTYIGKITQLGLDIYSYVDFYEDENGDMQEVFPADRLVMGRANAGGHFAHGAITDKKELGTEVFVGEVFVKSWQEDDPDDEFLLGKSRPLAVPSDIDSFKSVKAV